MCPSLFVLSGWWFEAPDSKLWARIRDSQTFGHHAVLNPKGTPLGIIKETDISRVKHDLMQIRVLTVACFKNFVGPRHTFTMMLATVHASAIMRNRHELETPFQKESAAAHIALI